VSAFSVIFSSPIVGRGFRAVAFLACFSCAAALVSAEEKERPYLSDEVGEQLGKVRPLFDEKKWDEALVIIDKVYAKAKPGSYDQAVLLNTKVQVYLSRNEFAKAIPCMEESLRISTQFGYFENKQNAELTYLLAQLYYSEGVTVKRSAEDQRTYFLKALEHIEKWDALTAKPTIDQLQFYASVLFNIAQSYGDAPATKAQKITYVKRAQAQTLRALQDTIRPKEPFYMLMVACAQELADYAQMAEYLELLVSQYPSNSQYWQQLFGCYVNLAGAQAKEKDSLPYNVRAILALERAQAVGQMNTPKDQYSLFSLYFNIQQYTKAAELMEAGLKSGAIEHEQRNYEMLSFCYQQLNKELKSIDVLKRAAARFPNAGQLYFQAANAYYSIDRYNDALESAKIAVTKGDLGQTAYKVHYFVAFLCYEMRKYQEGLAAIDKAISLIPAGVNEPNYPKMREAILVGLEDQEKIRKAVEAQRKQR